MNAIRASFEDAPSICDAELDVPSELPSLSIVIPAYNEAARIAHSLEAIGNYVRRNTDADFELIVVDDGSSDNTVEVVERSLPKTANLHSRIIRYAPNRGKGYAVRQGLLAARAPVALFSDADLSTPITELPKLVDLICNGSCDVAFGSRALDRRLIETPQPFYRDRAGRAFNAALRAATGLPFSDTQCGFKAFRMAACRQILESSTVDGFGFDVELLFVAHRAGLRLQEVPVRWRHQEGSKVRLSRDAPRMLGDIITVRRQMWTGHYNFAMRAATVSALSVHHAIR
jgi:dolichyl-phosphate beta-glucosyltransferase